SAMAGGHRDYHDDRHHYRGNHVDYARVISVKPIYEKRRNYHSDYRYDDSYDYRHRGSSTKPLVGAIIGGGLGHALGNHKKSKRVGAAVGAVLGAAIASDSRKKHRRHNYHDSRHYDYYKEIVGYKVKYRYNGRIYKTRTKYDPGRRIKVVVDVRPAHRY
ncbi:MAG: glycine zipper 2TM domain-containing protein, partial [Porticoccaceae bacterium]|nr:glycine zipper 2TM domain-containing protein [Porticoccaceae bacterium]